jgi:hypothetical protein
VSASKASAKVSETVQALATASRTFGPGAARKKARLLDNIVQMDRLPARDLLLLHDTVCFMRAYPDDGNILARIRKLVARLRDWVQVVRGGGDAPAFANTGLPGSVNSYAYSYAALLRMVAAFPGCLEIDWDEVEDESTIHNALVLVVTNNECQGLDDIHLSMAGWVKSCRLDPAKTDLEFLLQLFAGSHLSLQEQAYIFESAALPIRFRLDQPGAGRAEAWSPQDRIHYQGEDIPRGRFRLEPEIRRPFQKVGLVDNATGAALVELSLAALCGRNLEISSLVYANPSDVTLLRCGRGLQVALIGVVPEYRDALESTFFYLILKNGVPIAYGPASPCLGCCEMGLNLFPEFRGGEIHFIYSQLMRSLHHALGVRYFYLTAYGMGQDNPEAIRTGAFWFYRKLGFRASNPHVEALARAEEERMRQQPDYRSDTRMLRRLSDTDAFFDISGGRCERIELGAIGIAQSRFVADAFDGNRKLAVDHCVDKVAHALGCEDHERWSSARRRALKILAPILCMIPGFEAWGRPEKNAMLRIIKSKGGRSEAQADVLARKHDTYREALRALALPQ